MISATSSASLSTFYTSAFTSLSSPSAHPHLSSPPPQMHARPTLAPLCPDSFHQHQARQANVPLSAIHSSTPSPPEKHVYQFAAMTSSSSSPSNAAAAGAAHHSMLMTTENNNTIGMTMPPSPALAPFYQLTSQYDPHHQHHHGHQGHPHDGSDTSGFYYVYPPMPPPMSDDACQPPMPDASLLFGTPAPTRVPTAAPTVASSPSKTLLGFGRFGGASASSASGGNSGAARRDTSAADAQMVTMLTQAMAALQTKQAAAAAAAAAAADAGTSHSCASFNIHAGASSSSSLITTLATAEPISPQVNHSGARRGSTTTATAAAGDPTGTNRVVTAQAASPAWEPAVIRLKAPKLPQRVDTPPMSMLTLSTGPMVAPPSALQFMSMVPTPADADDAMATDDMQGQESTAGLYVSPRL